MGEMEVSAEVIDNDLMISQSSFEIDMSGIQRDIEDLTEAIDGALTVYGELLVAPEDVAALSAHDARQCEREISAAIRGADELRRKLNRDYRVPLDVAKKRYDELMAPVIELHAAYKQRRIEHEEAQKAEKLQAIRDLYENMATHIALPAEGHDGALVPFDRVFAQFGSKWLNKGCGLDAIELELVDIVGRILADERRLDEASPKHVIEAKAVFWDTLDADAALAHDRELCALEEREAARAAERAKLDQLKAAAAAPEASASPDASPAPAAVIPAPEAGGSAETSPAPTAARAPRVMLIDGATDDECRQIGQFCKSLGITGVFKGARLYEAVKGM